MRQNHLQFGKALSAALFVLLLVAVGTTNALAQTQVATLQHGDDVSAFYGANAFVEAHTAAADGDIVTLSSGTFNAPSQITKAITLRGAGVVSDTVAGTAPTLLPGDVLINVANDSVPFQMEGILITYQMRFNTLYNPKFTRCSFKKITSYSGGNQQMRNAQFVNCMIEEFDFRYAYSTTLVNSVVWNGKNIYSTFNVVLYNSIMRIEDNSGYSLEGLSAFNSIFVRANDSNNSNMYKPGGTCSFINCIGINSAGNNNPFGGGYTSGCTSYYDFADVFESFTGTFSMDEPFILKDEIATGFLGSDGNQVGIYGGVLPYSNRPTYMVLKRCNVAGRSTIDGKLSVEIEVVTEEE